MTSGACSTLWSTASTHCRGQRCVLHSAFSNPHVHTDPSLQEATARGDKDKDCILRMKLDCMESPKTHTSNTACPTEVWRAVVPHPSQLTHLQLVDMATYLKSALVTRVDMVWCR